MFPFTLQNSSITFLWEVCEHPCQQQRDKIIGKHFLRGNVYGGCVEPHLLVITRFSSVIQSSFKSFKFINNWSLSFFLRGTPIFVLPWTEKEMKVQWWGRLVSVTTRAKAEPGKRNPDFLIGSCDLLADEQKYVEL